MSQWLSNHTIGMGQIQMNNVERWSRQINVRDMIDKSRVLITKKKSHHTNDNIIMTCVSQTRYARLHDVFVYDTTDGRRSAFERCTARTREYNTRDRRNTERDTVDDGTLGVTNVPRYCLRTQNATADIQTVFRRCTARTQRA